MKWMMKPTRRGAETGRRLAEIENGTAELVPAEEVFAKLRRLEVIPARFHRAALEEVEAEWARYTYINPILGEAFTDSLEHALNLAREFPGMDKVYLVGQPRPI